MLLHKLYEIGNLLSSKSLKNIQICICCESFPKRSLFGIPNRYNCRRIAFSTILTIHGNGKLSSCDKEVSHKKHLSFVHEWPPGSAIPLSIMSCYYGTVGLPSTRMDGAKRYQPYNLGAEHTTLPSFRERRRHSPGNGHI